MARDRVSGRVRVSVMVRACRPDSLGNLLTRRKMEFAPYKVSIRTARHRYSYAKHMNIQ